jgi:hypothetical protein
MLRTPLLLANLALGCLSTDPAGGNPAVPQTTQTAQTSTIGQTTTARTATGDGGVAVTIETYCSDTKLRTPNARISWSTPTAVMAARSSAAAAIAAESIETTVFKNGFEKGLWVSLPLSPRASAARPIVPQAQPQLRRPTLRAFQIRVVGVEETARESAAAAGAAEDTSAVVENLEPGVDYSWRIAFDTPQGKIVSPVVRTRAPICPADFVASPAVPRRKP